ncbi:MAG: hypothetical protein Q4F06_08905 [Eubacteriales bacterium]|nr:hypothetical protein [Eubacteriales bacterium]
MKKIQLRIAGIIISAVLGLEVEAVFYFVFGINPLNIPVLAIVTLWAFNSVLMGCVVDEVFKRKYKVRI